jgi:hypothetical protein
LTRARLTIAFCLLPALIAAGCGGDDAGSPSNAQTGATPISKSDYVAQSDALCAQANQFVRGLNLSIASSLRQGDYQGAADAIDAQLARIKPLYAELLNLPKPAGDEATLNKLNDARSETNALIEQFSAAIRAQDNAEIRSVTDELDQAGKRSQELSAAYGFKTCGAGQS